MKSMAKNLLLTILASSAMTSCMFIPEPQTNIELRALKFTPANQQEDGAHEIYFSAFAIDEYAFINKLEQDTDQTISSVTFETNRNEAQEFRYSIEADPAEVKNVVKFVYNSTLETKLDWTEDRGTLMSGQSHTVNHYNYCDVYEMTSDLDDECGAETRKIGLALEKISRIPNTEVEVYFKKTKIEGDNYSEEYVKHNFTNRYGFYRALESITDDSYLAAFYGHFATMVHNIGGDHSTDYIGLAQFQDIVRATNFSKYSKDSEGNPVSNSLLTYFYNGLESAKNGDYSTYNIVYGEYDQSDKSDEDYKNEEEMFIPSNGVYTNVGTDWVAPTVKGAYQYDIEVDMKLDLNNPTKLVNSIKNQRKSIYKLKFCPFRISNLNSNWIKITQDFYPVQEDTDPNFYESVFDRVGVMKLDSNFDYGDNNDMADSNSCYL